jgi:hypothetical protein
MFWKFRFLSVRTETEPNYPKPKSLGSEFSEEPIGSRFTGNRINRITEEPNRSVSVNRTPRVNLFFFVVSSKWTANTGTGDWTNGQGPIDKGGVCRPAGVAAASARQSGGSATGYNT